MKQVEYFRWWVTAPGRRRPYLTSFPMSAEQAAANYPDARPELATREVRELPDSEAEVAAAMFMYQSAGHDSVKPPPAAATTPKPKP